MNWSTVLFGFCQIDFSIENIENIRIKKSTFVLYISTRDIKYTWIQFV